MHTRRVIDGGAQSKQRGSGQHEHEIEAGDPFFVDAEESQSGVTEIRQPVRSRRHPGQTRRRIRVAELELLASRQIRRDYRGKHGSEIPDDELKQEVAAYIKSLYADPDRDRFEKHFADTSPTSRSPQNNHPNIEIAAVRRLPLIRWLERVLMAKTNRAGASASLRLVVAVFFQLAFTSNRKSVRAARRDILDNQPCLNWAHDYPGSGQRQSAFYEALKKMLAERDPSAATAVNIELVKELAALRDDKGRPRHPLIGQNLAVDGTLIEADVQQRQAKGELKDLLHGPERELVEMVIYRAPDGTIGKLCVGYRLTILVDLASTLPIAAHFGPANLDERSVVLELMRAVFAAWPEIEPKTLSGDSLYQHSKELARQLVFNYGVQPIFPERAQAYAADLPYAATEGVPHCLCGEMKVRNREGFFDVRRRRELGLKLGEQAPTRARIRWQCPNQICKSVTTYPWNDARLYTFYPRQGRDELAVRRRVLAVRRNAVESVFASLKRAGCGGRGLERPSWAGDDQYRWLLYCGLVGLAARRLAWETGGYEAARAEAEELGLLEQPSLELPAPGPEAEELARARTRRQRDLKPARAPTGWPGVDEFKVGARDQVAEVRARELTQRLAGAGSGRPDHPGTTSASALV